jgi:hypothetical protein
MSRSNFFPRCFFSDLSLGFFLGVETNFPDTDISYSSWTAYAYPPQHFYFESVLPFYGRVLISVV